MNEQQMMTGFAALVARRREFIQEVIESPPPAPQPAQAPQPAPSRQGHPPVEPAFKPPVRTQVHKPMRLTKQKDILRQTILQTGAERMQQTSTFWVESSL